MDEAAALLRGAESVTRRMLDGYSPSLHHRRWIYGGAVDQPAPPITAEERAWLLHVIERSHHA